MPVRIDHAPGQPAHTTAALDASGSNGRANDWGVEPPGIVAFAGKGGVGKSTLLVSTAVYLIARGWAVVVVDLDQTNQSIEQWRLIRERMRANELADVKLVTVPVVAQGAEEPAPAALDRAEEYMAILRSNAGAGAMGRLPLILVDLPGGDGYRVDPKVLERVDAAFLPAEPTTIAVGATRRLASTFGGSGHPRLRFVANRFQSERRKVEAVTALGDGYVADAAVRSYVMHQDAYSLGLGVTEYAWIYKGHGPNEPKHNACKDIEDLGQAMDRIVRVIRTTAPNAPRLGTRREQSCA